MSEMQSTDREKKNVKMVYTKSFRQLMGVIGNYMAEAKTVAADPSRLKAWATAGFPMELLWSQDVFNLMPENSAIIAAMSGLSMEMIECSESIGYCRDLCSYMKTAMGSYRKELPFEKGGLLTPDYCVATNTICDTHWKWFEIEARRMGVPYFCFDMPSFVSGSGRDRMDFYTEYVENQIYDYFEFMERNFKIKHDEAKFMSAMRNSERVTNLWGEIMQMRRRIPSPYLFQETMNALFPLALFIGLERSVEIFEVIVADLRERVSRGEGAVQPGEERFRLIWEGIPLWHRTKFYNELLQYGAVVAYEPYTESFGMKKRVKATARETISDLARCLIHLPYNYNLETRIQYFKNLIHDYGIHGVILHHNMSCRPSATGLLDLKNAIQADTGVPVLLLDCDQTDPRAYSEGQVKTRVEGFIELMEASTR
jgi:benzoyl-CoA reductase/2-hydroxyglutaryl-CoA dehydratase subunit BcrC/BadD/HgdB